MTKTRGFTRDELVDMAFHYVRAGGREATEDTAAQLIDAARDSMLGREDVPELREEDGDREIVRLAIAHRLVELALDSMTVASDDEADALNQIYDAEGFGGREDRVKDADEAALIVEERLAWLRGQRAERLR